MNLTFAAPTPAVSADLGDDRTIRGLVVPYGVTGRTDAGDLKIRAGGLRTPADLRRVKLFRDHGRTTPVGYAHTREDTDETMRMAFRVAATPEGDTALLEASEGVRDALSVELDNADIRGEWIESADVVAVALVPLPAYADARVNAAATTTGRNTMTAPDPDTLDPVDPDKDDDDETDEPKPAEVTASTRRPAIAASLNPSAPRRRVQVTAAAAIDRIRSVVRGATDASQVNAALSDVVPANDGGQGFLRDQWLGELWTPVAGQRPYISAMTAATLTGMRFYGWKWETQPEVDDYAGNKAAIPSNPVSIVPVEGTAYRLAGGWDVDRIFVDLGAPGFLEAMFSAAVADYGKKSNAAAGTFLAANATVLSNVVTNLVDALAACAAALAANGASVSWIAIAPDLWSDYLSLTAAEAPWWLSIAAGSVSIKDPSGSVADLSFFVDPTLPAGTVLAGDKRATTHFEAAGSPLRVQAVNIPNGGIDIAVFGYAGDLLTDGKGLVKIVVGAGATRTAPASRSAKAGS
jgi:hypothetical protein